MREASVEKEGRRSERKNAVSEEFSRIYEILGYRNASLIAWLRREEFDYTLSDGEKVHIDGWELEIDSICLRMERDIETLLFLYPQIVLDEHFKIIEGGLKNYRVKGLRRRRINKELLREMYVASGPVMSKVYLAGASIKDIEDRLFFLKSQDPRAILEPLVGDPLQAFKKNTNPIRDLARKMKEHMIDKDIWKHYRNTWKQLNQQLKLFGLPHYDTSEDMLANIDDRYPTSEKLNVIDMEVCRELMNEIIDVVDVYDSIFAG